MTKSGFLLLLFVAISTILLYMLPRYVVNNTKQVVSNSTSNNATTGSRQPAAQHNHSFQLPDSMAAIIEGLYESFKNAENQEKRIIFADSLAKAYKTVGKLDSLAKYTEIKAVENPSLENFTIIGDVYYQAFNFAVDQTKRRFLAEKAQEYYNRVLEEDSTLLDIKSKLAMTYVAGSNPMQGIIMLREVLEEDPNNELAIYNLGMLAINSGQWDKAIDRFEKLKHLDPQNPEAYFYLGYCLFELGKEENSKSYFQKVLDLGISGDLVDASEEYLKKINK
ncbi:MAG: tetratricopeptide repeat protein [Cyclobacteriaceae bacterium]|nr:tetratricopeptide repeat protein [Cyclobacteriaceae bacterium]MCK5468881.1 tetratricopeptide repeat protein [Cyclobacteriaceae bacterium]MCK5699680.1 tetratricopeptide repeat protein [Cyclobacteriaceae bacterium]